jgi:dTDP-4-dehydrorhamnose 3,5-epimerase
MEVSRNNIEGLVVIKPKVFEDGRGYFYESYSVKEFETVGISKAFVQDNQSLSSAGVLRGLHFQAPPFAQAKLVRVIKGAVLDVALDIRKNSPTYGQHFAIELSEENKMQFYIPEGFAHGFLTLRNDTIFSYKCSAYYNKNSEGSVLWNDPSLKINWDIENPILSEKDLAGKKFSEFVSPF